MKWGFGCREPLPGMHEAYVAARWRQALGSAMHCVAGDGVGILTGAVIAARLLVRLGNFSGIVHARRDRRVVCALAEIDARAL